MKLTLVIIGLISSAILFWFLKQEYRPAIVVRTADQFITFLQNGELEKAHELTLKTAAIGKDLEDFKKNVDRQWRLILFEVRFFRTGENTWKISYFQSHAG